MRKYLMYISLTKKFVIKRGEKVHRYRLGELKSSEMIKAQEEPDKWILIEGNHV